MSSHKQNIWGIERNKQSDNSGSIWDHPDEEFPKLVTAENTDPLPVKNVWKERQAKTEAVQAMMPVNADDEEAMIQWAIELSKLEAAEEEKRKRQVKEQYKLQLQLLDCDAKDSDDSESDSPHNKSSTSIHRDATNGENNKLCDKEVSSKSYNACSGANQTTITYNGAKPKFGKIIETFGGWGLKDNSLKQKDQNGKTKASKSKTDVRANTDNGLKKSRSVNNGAPKRDYCNLVTKNKNHVENDLKNKKFEDAGLSSDLSRSPGSDIIDDFDNWEDSPKEKFSDYDLEESEWKKSADTNHLLNEPLLNDEIIVVTKGGSDCYVAEKKPYYTSVNNGIKNENDSIDYLQEMSDKYLKHKKSGTDILSEVKCSSSDVHSAQSSTVQDSQSPSSKSKLTHSFDNEHKLESLISQINLNSDLQSISNKIDALSNDDIFSSFIEPPKPRNKPGTAVCDTSESCILPPKPPPEVSAFPNASQNCTINDLTLKSAVDPQLLQHMFLLSNPFFFSQLQAIEMFYRSRGISTSAFQSPQQSFAPFLNNAANVNNFQPQELLNIQTVESGPSSFERSQSSNSHSQPPGIDVWGMTPETTSFDPLSYKNLDSWLNKYTPEGGTSFIPAPKQPEVHPSAPLPSKNCTSHTETKASALDAKFNPSSSMWKEKSDKTGATSSYQGRCSPVFRNSNQRKSSESNESDKLEELEYIPLPAVTKSTLQESSSKRNRQPTSQSRLGSMRSKNTANKH